MRRFLSRGTPPFDRVLLVESGSRQLYEDLLRGLYDVHPNMRADVLTCFAGVPKCYREDRGSVYRVGGIATGVNYGSNRVRFIEPVRVNSRIRSKVKLLAVEPYPPGMRITTESTVEIEGRGKPALVAENMALMIPG